MRGREAPTPLARGVRLGANATLVSPPLDVPPGAQALSVAAAAPNRGALLEVRAAPVAGGPETALALLEPPARPARMAVGLGPVAGRRVRIVLDPVPGLGSAVEVRRVGPLTAPLPGWSLLAGSPSRERRGGRAAIVVRDDPVIAASPAFAPGPGARWLLVAVRGEGRVRAVAGGRAATVPAGPRWRDLAVPLRPGRRARLRVEARPGAGGALELRDIGLVRRATRITGLRAARRGARVVVTARLGPAGARLAAQLRSGRRRVAATRADARGRLRLVAPAGGPLTLVVPGDRTRAGARARVSR